MAKATFQDGWGDEIATQHIPLGGVPQGSEWIGPDGAKYKVLSVESSGRDRYTVVVQKLEGGAAHARRLVCG